jgi:putative oxidoreductase
MKKLLSPSSQAVNFGLLIIRIGIGIMFVLYGEGKMFGGPEKWAKLGGAMEGLGITFLPAFWGFMAALAEFGGGILLVLGLLFRPACFLMFCTMFVAASVHWIDAAEAGEALKGKIMSGSHAIELGIVFLALLFTGPGKYSVDNKLF